MVIRFEELLNEDGKLVYKTRGFSMEPMLKQDRDIVVIQATNARLKRLDVAFYKRGDQYVLHRVLTKKGDVYIIRGDNTFIKERVPCEDVIGILVSFQRKGKSISANSFLYRLYAHIWTVIYPLRLIYKKARHLVGRILRKAGLRQ